MRVDQKDYHEERHLFLMVKDADEANPNIVHATVSTDEVDRYDEVVLPDAFKEALPAFLRNPVVLPAHQHRLPNGDPPVIGNVLTDSIHIGEHTVDMTVEFDTDELGQKYAKKYRKRKDPDGRERKAMMRAFSIGFRGLEGEYRSDEKTRTWTWTRIELLEVSAVAVPANRGALARAFGYYEHEPGAAPSDSTADVVERAIEKLDAATAAQHRKLEESLDEIKSLLIPDSEELAQGLLGSFSEPDSAGDNQVTDRQFVELFRDALKSIANERMQ